MLLKAMKLFALVMLMNTFSSTHALADTKLHLNTENSIVSQVLEALKTIAPTDQYSIKGGQPYDQSNDPAFKSSAGGPEQTSPQHGYFAVPLIVIGLAGILLYFSKFD
ncbi:MAG: hypothetical protein HOO93_10915 [Methyloglobulus sp.]|nr:hypothetical protein [Methyloglobulus sp.]